MKFRILKFCLLLFLINTSLQTQAQKNRNQLPKLLQHSYFEMNFGSIFYPFSEAHIEDGYTFHSVDIPSPAVRFVLLGYKFNKNLSAQITYMRPVLWVKYYYSIDGAQNQDLRTFTVWMNYVGLTAKYKYSVGKRLSIFGEGGYHLVTRNGYTGAVGPLVKSKMFSSIVIGGGLDYRFNDRWSGLISAIASPEIKKQKQPGTAFISIGGSYHLNPFSKKQIDQSTNSAHCFPKQMIQIGYSGNNFGYGINNLLESVYLFWGGNAEVNHGFSINYQRNIFHRSKIFSMDWGVNFSIWQSNLNREKFITLSIFPVFRFTLLRSKSFDGYLFYSVAGPSYVSRLTIDNFYTGGNFSFQDNMGVGIFWGDQRKYNAELKIGHYSNGNILPKNPGIKIPLTFSVGFTF